MKFLLSSVIVLSLTCSVFAAKFEAGKCWQLIKTNDFTSIVNYLKTNNECPTFFAKIRYVLFSLVEPGRVKKTITVSNFESTIDAIIANSKLSFTDDEKIICKLFCYSRSPIAGINKLNLIDNFEVFFNKYSTKFDQLAMNKTYTNIIVSCILGMSYNSKKPNFERMLKYSLFSTRDTNIKYGLIAAKRIGPTGIVKVCESVSKNPTKIIRTAKQLNDLINLTKQLNDSKYDSVVKPLYVKLKRVFYARIAESDDWKAAVTNLQLQINAYNIQ